jgi:hypothetical protein
MSAVNVADTMMDVSAWLPKNFSNSSSMNRSASDAGF